MQLWSDLPAPGTILMGHGVMGGGIATSAGGVKLLRLFALYRHGLREMDLLIHPSAVLGRGPGIACSRPTRPALRFIFLLLFPDRHRAGDDRPRGNRPDFHRVSPPPSPA